MKLTTFFLIVSLFQLQAYESYAQRTKISLDLEKVSLEKVLDKIESLTDFKFLYDYGHIDYKKEVSIKVENERISSILDRLLEGSNIVYKVVKKQIILKQDNNSNVKIVELDKSSVLSQEIQVEGIVNDLQGQPLPGASILEKGTTNGTQSDFDGKFSLKVSSNEAILVVSYVGFLSQEVSIANQTNITVSLVEDLAQLNEVVVVGYGTQKKINLTGAVDVIKADKIENRAVTNVSEALQGLSPNLNIASNGWDTEPGGTKSINLRGIGSLNGNTAPYILVDGVPMDLNAINPNDIESFTVLKDAASSAIYGSKAAFGVILITTKKGASDKLKVTYSNNFSFSKPLGLPHMVNNIEYMTAHDQAQVNAGLAPTFTDEAYERTRQYINGQITDETWVRDDANDWHGNNIWSLSGNANNDWLYIYYDDVTLRQKHDLSFSGGNDKTTFFVSGGYFDQPDELRYGDQFYKRINATTNLTSKINKWLSLDINLKYVNERRQYFNASNGWSRDIQYHNFYRTNPFRPLYLPNGEFSPISYIPAMIDGGKDKRYDNQFLGTAGFNLHLMEGWDASIRYNYRNNSNRRDDTRKTVIGHFPDGSAYPMINPGTSSYHATSFSRTDYQLIYATTSYEKSIENHNFKVLAGYEFELSQYNSLYGRKNNLLTSNLPSISTATGEISVDDSKSHWATQGYFGRLTYNFDEKYLIEFNSRYDASSRFAKDSRWGFFPSISAGYNISKEAFWEPMKSAINTLKIRGSWGSLGNQNVSNYLYLSTLGIHSNLYWIMDGVRPDYTTGPGLVSNNLTWETSTTTDIGFDATFLNNRLTANFDYYVRETSDMFGPAEALPRTLGTGVPRLNNATLETKGFELSLNWRDKIGDDFNYSIGVNLSDNVSKVTRYNNPTKTLSTWFEGRVIGDIWGLGTNGLYQTQAEADNGPDQTLFWPTWGPGDVAYVDKDGDNKISRGTWTYGDTGDYHVIGNSTPRYNYGILINAEWKGFDLNVLLQGVGKRDYAFTRQSPNFFGFNANFWWDMNVYEQTKDYWRPSDETNILGPNTDAYLPKPYLSVEDNKNKEPNTRYMQDASYMRLKNITIGYNLPSHILDQLGASSARFFVSGENLLTFTKLTSLFDPEGLSTLSSSWGVGKMHPHRKVFALGLNITF